MRLTRLPGIRTALFLALIVHIAALGTVYAGESQAIDFRIPPQPLASAIDAFAEKAGTEVSYPADLTVGKESPGVTGRYSAEQALQQLLRGTDVRARYTENGTITLERPASDPMGQLLDEARRPMQLAQATGTSKAPRARDAEATGALPEMTVTAKPWEATSYTVPNATTATKTDTPIMETPVNIQVIPQQVLKDQQAFRLEQALRNVSGVYMEPLGTFQGSGEIFSLRGFATDDVYRNGFRTTNIFSGIGPLETANLERIEVLKGPASILYGRIEPGGLINLVPKQPLVSPYYSLQQLIGSFDFYRTTLDATGPMTNDDALLYRFNLAYENAGSFVEFTENERIFLAPTLRWNIGPDTQATFELQYKHSRDPRPAGIPAIGDRPADVPRERNLGEPLNEVESDDVLISFDWSHAFNESWTVRHRFYADWTDASEDLVQPDFLDTDGRTLIRSFFSSAFDTETYTTSLDLTGKFDTWGLGHTLLLGGDYYDFQNVFDPVITRSFTSIDIFNPIHGGQIGLDPTFDFFAVQDSTEHWYGFYLQDQVQLPYHFHLLAGFRYDNATSRTLFDILPSPDAETPDLALKFEGTDESVNPRVGLLWQPVPELSLYGNYVENFGSTNAFSLGPGNTQLPAETAQQWEVGLKTELLDRRLTGTLAWFNLTKQNIATPDPFNPLVSRLTGEARNQGLEVDVAGEILTGWQVIGVYSYIDSEITKDAEDAFGNPIGNQGHRFFNIPRHGGSFWTTYEIQQGLIAGLKLGAGVVARSEREGDNENSYQLPGYMIGNLLVGYERKVGPSKLAIQLNVENITDETYFAGSQGVRTANAFGAPRTFLGSVRVEW